MQITTTNPSMQKHVKDHNNTKKQKENDKKTKQLLQFGNQNIYLENKANVIIRNKNEIIERK